MDRDMADEILHRTGAMLMLYYPELPADDENFRLAHDIDWVLDGLIDLGTPDDIELRRLVGRTIIDPSVHREALFGFLHHRTETGDEPSRAEP